MSEIYNLDEKKGIFDFFKHLNATKVLEVGHRVQVLHYSLFDSVNGVIIDVESQYVKLKFRTEFPELDFFENDPIVLNFMDNETLYVLSGNILNIESYTPLTMTISVDTIEKKESLRKNERFHVSLAGKIKVDTIAEPAFCIVKNLSLGGVKVNSKYALENKQDVQLDLMIDDYYSICINGRIVRKNEVKDFYEYGIEIISMSEPNQVSFEHYINKLK
jgi:hypothetical protein